MKINKKFITLFLSLLTFHFTLLSYAQQNETNEGESQVNNVPNKMEATTEENTNQLNENKQTESTNETTNITNQEDLNKTQASEKSINQINPEAEKIPALKTGSITIEVVDEKNTPFNGEYTLYNYDTYAKVGDGIGAEKLEDVKTWVLNPGIYKLVKKGGSYSDRIDFATVEVNPDQSIHYRIVIEKATGSFRGGGIIFEEETPQKVKFWDIKGTIGAGFQFTHRQDVVGAENGSTYAADGFADLGYFYEKEIHNFNTKLHLEAGATKTPNTDFRKSLDNFDWNALYIIQLVKFFGPYVRASLKTNMISGYDYYDSLKNIIVYDSDRNEVLRRNAISDFQVGSSFSIFDINESVGGDVTILNQPYCKLDFRVGFAFSQLIARDLYTQNDDSLTEDILEYKKIDDFTDREGMEFGLTGIGNLTSWINYDLGLTFIEPFNDYKNPIVNFNFNLNISIYKYLTLNYMLRIKRDVVLSDNTQFEQGVILRFVYNLF